MNIETQGETKKIEFNSIEEFYHYIITQPINNTFYRKELSSIKIGREEWCGTKTFEEACDLLKNGWSVMTEKLNNRLKVEGKVQPAMTYKNVQSIEGYHPIVPLYLMGIPNNMVTKKMAPMKHKVITINKSINYSYKVNQEQIIDESVKALRIIQRLESQNYRVNLNLIIGVSGTYKYRNELEKYFIKIRLKSSTEKLNISKLSFPLVHPSMLRRLFLRFIEVFPGIGSTFLHGYGIPLEPVDLRKIWPNDILLPQFILKDIEKINTLEDLENL